MEYGKKDIEKIYSLSKIYSDEYENFDIVKLKKFCKDNKIKPYTTQTEDFLKNKIKNFINKKNKDNNKEIEKILLKHKDQKIIKKYNNEYRITYNVEKLIKESSLIKFKEINNKNENNYIIYYNDKVQIKFNKNIKINYQCNCSDYISKKSIYDNIFCKHIYGIIFIIYSIVFKFKRKKISN
jgi:hypothetical protein